MSKSTPLQLFKIRNLKVNRDLYEHLLSTCSKINELELYSIANSLESNEGQQFIEFCRLNNLVRDWRFTDDWARQYPHSLARQYPKQEKRDFVGAAKRMYREV